MLDKQKLIDNLKDYKKRFEDMYDGNRYDSQKVMTRESMQYFMDILISRVENMKENDDMITNEKIIDALEVIKGVCKNYKGDCDKCSLGTNTGHCNLDSPWQPKDWTLNKKVSTWKAFE